MNNSNNAVMSSANLNKYSVPTTGMSLRMIQQGPKTDSFGYFNK